MLLAYVRYYSQRYGFFGHLWQGRFKSPVVPGDGYWLGCGRYIERNPVEAGMTTEPWSYPWSSCRAYASGKADPLLTENPAVVELSPDAGRCRTLWREFLIGRRRPRGGRAPGRLGRRRRRLPPADGDGAGAAGPAAARPAKVAAGV